MYVKEDVDIPEDYAYVKNGAMLYREVLPEVEEKVVKGKDKKSKEELLQPVHDTPKHDLIN